MLIFLFPLLLLTLVSNTFSQNTFLKTYGGTGHEAGYDVIPVNDKGLIVTGTTTSFGNGKKDLYLLRTDSSGNEIWSSWFGDTGYDIGRSIESCSNIPPGGFVVLGTSERFNPDTQKDLFLIRFDENNKYLWSRYYGGTMNDDGVKVKRSPDGGFTLLGTSESFENTSNYFYLVNTDSLGVEKWSRVYGTLYDDIAVSLDVCTDGGYVLLGHSIMGNSTTELLLVKCNDKGNELWRKFIGGLNNETAGKILEAKDRGFYIVGTTNSFGATTNDILLMKTDSAGNIRWKKLIDTKGSDEGIDMIQLSDSSLTLLCSSDSVGSRDMEDFYLIHTDPEGNILWTNRWGSSNEDYPRALVNSGDSGVALVGETYGFDQYQGGILLVKHDRGGDTIAFPVKFFQNTSVNDPFLPDAGFNFFPNPSGNNVSFILNNFREEELVIEILDISGRQMFIQKITGSMILDAGFLPNGIYITNIRSGKRIYKRKWVKTGY